MTIWLGQLLTKLEDIRHDAKGVSAVEFALILPLLIFLWLATIEITQAISADRKVSLLTRTIADVLTQENYDQTQRKKLFAAAAQMMQPFDVSPELLSIKVEGITSDGKESRVIWESDYPTAGCTSVDRKTDNDFASAGAFTVRATVSYKYRFVFSAVTGKIGDKEDGATVINLGDTVTMLPRNGKALSCS